MKRKTKILIIAGIVLCLCLVAGVLVYNHLGKNLEALTEAAIPTLDLSETKDGTYPGSFSTFPVSAKVEVTIENHTIISIDLVKHVTGEGQAAETIPDTVVASQSVDVETVTGATYSSVVILKAIESALMLAGGKPI